MKSVLTKLREKGWTVKIVQKSKKEVSVLHFSGLDFFRVSVIGFLALLVVFGYFLIAKTQEKATVLNLESQLRVTKHQLTTTQQQKAQVETLLDREARNLEDHLKRLRKQEDGIRRILGQTPHARRTALKQANQIRLVAYRFANKSARGGPSMGLALRLARLQQEISGEEVSLGQIKQEAVVRHRALSHIPSLWPASGVVTSGFGYRQNPFPEFHEGVDIAVPYDSPVRAAAAGICILSQWDGGFGNSIKIDHGNGIVTQYSHCSRLLVRVGEQVTKGEVVALSGCTGECTGPHVHYQVFNHGQIVDPTSYLH